MVHFTNGISFYNVTILWFGKGRENLIIYDGFIQDYFKIDMLQLIQILLCLCNIKCFFSNLVIHFRPTA